MIDLTTEFGARVAQRLSEEVIIWLVTVRFDGTPQPSPVWFLWDGQAFTIYSQPNTAKIRNIQQNPKVALHLDGDGRGGNIIVFTGKASIVPQAPLATEIPAYVEKYRSDIARIKMDPTSFAQRYSVALQVVPTSLRGH